MVVRLRQMRGFQSTFQSNTSTVQIGWLRPSHTLLQTKDWQMFPNSTLTQAEYWRLNFDGIYTYDRYAILELELWTDD